MAIELIGICDGCKAPIRLGDGYGLFLDAGLKEMTFLISKGISRGDKEEQYCGNECLLKKLSASVDEMAAKPRKRRSDPRQSGIGGTGIWHR